MTLLQLIDTMKRAGFGSLTLRLNADPEGPVTIVAEGLSAAHQDPAQAVAAVVALQKLETVRQLEHHQGHVARLTALQESFAPKKEDPKPSEPGHVGRKGHKE